MGMALTPDSGAKSAAPKMGGTQYEWSKQHASASFKGGGGLKPRSSAQIPDVDEVNDFQHKGNDKSLPWTKQFQSEKWQAGMALTHSPDPKVRPAWWLSQIQARRLRTLRDYTSFIQRKYFLLLVTFTSTRGSYKCITSALFGPITLPNPPYSKTQD